MKYKALLLLILCLVFGDFSASGQIKPDSRFASVKTVTLRQIGKYGGTYTDKTLKISNVVLEDVRGYKGDWAHLFQLYDPRTRFRRGAKKTENENPCCIQEFSIFADEQIGIPLLEQIGEWRNKRVNVYLRITDLGLTPLMYVGFVMRVERLNDKGKVEKTLSWDERLNKSKVEKGLLWVLPPAPSTTSHSLPITE